VLIVFSETPVCEERMDRIRSVVGPRGELLNWSERKAWKRWELGPQIFRFYRLLGPPPFRLESALPVILVFKRFSWPKRFDFSGGQADRDCVSKRLEATLG
jgi:hypothetical protein